MVGKAAVNGCWAEAIERGQVSEEAITQARVEQDAQVAGYRLTELRQRTGMTQAQVADAMGVSQSRVSAMERGDVTSLTLASVRTYITALGGTIRLVASIDDTDITLRLPADAGTAA